MNYYMRPINLRLLKVQKSRIQISLFFIYLFFGTLLFVYGQGPSFDFQASEEQRLEVTQIISKGPFLTALTCILLLVSSMKQPINFNYVASYKLWFLFFVILFVLVFSRNNVTGELMSFAKLIRSYLLLFLILYFAYRIPPNMLERNFIKLSFIILLLTVVIHYLQGHELVFFPDRSSSNFDRLGGLFYYAHTGAIAAITSVFAFKRFLRTKKFFYGLVGIASLVLMVATDTRSAWFAALFSMFMILFKRLKLFHAILLSVIVYVLVANYSYFIGSKSAGVVNDTEFRGEIWMYSLKIASSQLFTGYGIDNPLENNRFFLYDKLRDPHNSLISLLLKDGILVLALYFIIFFVNARRCRIKYNSDYLFIFFFCLFFPFFWGKIYNDLDNFINMYLMFCIYAFALNPNNLTFRNRQSSALKVESGTLNYGVN